jgi:hypothetical protein
MARADAPQEGSVFVSRGDTSIDIEPGAPGDALDSEPSTPAHVSTSRAPADAPAAPERRGEPPDEAPSVAAPEAKREPAPELERPNPKPDDVPRPIATAAPEAPKAAWDKMFSSKAEQVRAASEAASAGSGAAGVRVPVSNLAKAFTRAIPMAVSADRTWAGLALGNVGSARVVFNVDAEKRLGPVALHDERRVPALLRRLIEKTVLLIKSGRFALSQSEATAGTETLRIDLTISTLPPGAADEVGEAYGLGNVSPLPGRPGKAHFQAWGRMIEAKVTIEATRAAD